jgi:Tannase and feruloyl esterase
MRLYYAVVLAVVLPAAGRCAAASCDHLAKLDLPHTAVTTAESIPAGDYRAPDHHTYTKLPAFCRVAGTIRPTADSDIQFEVWMPATGWNGKFEGVGNGGFAGSISYQGLALAVGRGYATASTDTGHQGSGTSAAWAQGHPEKIVDFGYRAIHETAANAKSIIRAFYGGAPKHSYFSSCSNGGRQALMEAQRYPADYDGIIAGAPANYWTHLLVGAGWDVKATLADAESYIPAAKLPAIQAAALSACDALDGVKDGVIEDPRPCRFDPSRLLCPGPESDACLTAPQLTALKKIYSGPHNAAGRPVFPGYSPGGEAEPGGWALWITGSARERSLSFAFGTQFFKNMVYDPAWDYHTFTVDGAVKAADAKMAAILNATDPDLKAFKARGGKLILYHGWSDAAIPAQNTVDYYESVVHQMGAKAASAFVRLYMVPGMQHCGGGAGPDVFGQWIAAPDDPGHDLAAGLERWVEKGTPPEKVIATRYKTGDKPESGVLRTRPLCPYPLAARWKGAGSTDEAANFVCATTNSKH